ncbi:D-alanine--poly(phosphoribitol) ligase subunit DltA [Bacillus cereus]|nr:D-alanine--poly(phosphoribitol) ligase subunit DltA [Bacillus cereus]MCU4856164.1 D-alanine--poly(phosphoribitol) ligase subunit DltA [Bacillus cereus]MCU4872888.1 D-alanine--poly(phosphoribitol) ligase subunit DltA [Bacillus cereus]MCU4941425.1 D-alanine--poly(phosphoribitol) ligase subunit DltA [Bacillus cereus]
MKLLEQIEKWAAETPDQTAFVWRDAKITYKQLKEDSDALAHWISSEYPDDRSPIMVYGHMQPEMIINFLGCVKAGHAYIPVDLSIPADRVQRIAENSGAKLLLSATAVTVTDLPVRIVSEDNLKDIFFTHKGNTPNPEHAVKGDENFYIIYTSGSTGNPKGVQITYNCLVSFTKWAVEDFNLQTGQVFLNQAPFSFDLSVMDIYPSLVTGGTLWAIDKDMIARPKDLFASLEQSDIQVWTSTPSFAEMCLMEASFSESMLPNMKTFLFCGEVLPNEVARKLIERFPKATIMNTYGPTEATVAVTGIHVTEEVLDQYKSLPVGYCKSDCRLLIMKKDGTIAPDGEKGEIVIVGPSVSVGYLGSPELTEKAFTMIDGERAYKTGDAGYVENGLLFYNGRLDFQIKLHGYRMELEEIEHHLRACSYVEGAVIVPIKKGEKYDYLLAVVVPGEHSFEKEFKLTSAIKKELNERLPNYMIPRKFMYQSSIPMTPNGKVDRKKLLSEVTA